MEKYKITAGIDGMMCGMCEAHICDTVRNVFPDASKVSASRKKGTVSFVLSGPVDVEKLKKAVGQTGYSVTSVTSEPYRARFLFG